MKNQPIGMILSAGFGTRLKPLSELRPKPVMEIAGKPIIYLLVKMLENAGIKDIVINLHYFPEYIRSALNTHPVKARLHFIYEKSILGTAGGLANALTTLGIKNRSLCLLHGDIVCDIDLLPYFGKEEDCTLICAQDLKIDGYQGGVALDKENTIVELGPFYKSTKKAVSYGFLTGIHFLSPYALDLVKRSSQESLVGEVYPTWLSSGFLIKGVMKPLYYEDIGSIKRLFLANMSVLENPTQFNHLNFLEGFLPLNDQNDVFIGDDVRIDGSVKLKGPVMIAKGAVIEKNVCIGPYVVVGQNVRIGENSTVRNSVILSQTTIEKGEWVDHVVALKSARCLVKGASFTH